MLGLRPSVLLPVRPLQRVLPGHLHRHLSVLGRLDPPHHLHEMWRLCNIHWIFHWIGGERFKRQTLPIGKPSLQRILLCHHNCYNSSLTALTHSPH